MDAAELVELRKQGSISQEEFFVGLNRLRRANNGSSAAVAEASAADLIPGGGGGGGGGGGVSASAVNQEQRCSSHGSADTAVDTERRRRADEEKGSCAGGVAQRGVGLIDGPGATSVEIVEQRSAIELRSESSDQIESVVETEEDTGSGRGAVASGRRAPQLQGDGFDSTLVLRTEPHHSGMVPLSSTPESTQQHLLLAAEFDGAYRMPHRADNNNGRDTQPEPAGADENSGWLVSPRGEKSRQSTGRRRRSPLSGQEMLRRQSGRRMDEGGDDSFDGDRKSTRALAAHFPPQKGGNHRVSEDVAIERRLPVESPSVCLSGGARTQPDRHTEDGSNGSGSGSGDNMRLCRQQPPAAPRSDSRDACEANHSRGGGYGKAGYPLGLLPKRIEGGRNGGVGADATISTTRPHWRPAGPAKPQSQRRKSAGSAASSTGGERRRCRSLSVTPLRSRHPGDGHVREEDEQRGRGDVGLAVEELSDTRSADDPMAASRKGGSPVKAHWRPAGGGHVRPRFHHGEGVERGCRSHPATSSCVSPPGTASLPTAIAVGNGATSPTWKEESACVGETERRYNLGLDSGSCSSGADYHDPCRSPPRRRRPHLRSDTPAQEEEEEEENEALSPASLASPGGSVTNRVVATPYASRRRHRDDGKHSTCESVVDTEAASEGKVPPEKLRPRGAEISDPRARGSRGGCGGGCGGRGCADASVDIDTGTSSASKGGLWRNRSRHREPQGAPESRVKFERLHRGSANGSVGGFDAGRSGTVAARCDRYGYPLHERECLGSTGGGESGGHELRFSPMTKGLPDFYESRPKRQSQDGPFQQSMRSAREGGLSPPPKAGMMSLYERTTEWQARSSELRARKLAQREEQELSACTFQPNVPQRETSGFGDALAAGVSVEGRNVRSEQPDNAGRDRRNDLSHGGAGGGDGGDVGGEGDGVGVGVDDGVDRGEVSGGGDECEGRMGEGTVTGTDNTVERKRSSVISRGSAASSRRRFDGSVAQRLFNEAGRMDERRFEGQERRRMWDEETYARTCTFQPSLVQGKYGSTTHVPSRYRDPPRAASAPPTGRRPEVDQDALTFHPKILGVKPGMTRALEYVSLGVTERLYHAHPIGTDNQLQKQPPETSFSPGCPPGGQRLLDSDDFDNNGDQERPVEGGGYPPDVWSPQPARLGRRGCFPDRRKGGSNDAGLGESDRGEGGSWVQSRRRRGERDSYFERRQGDGRSTQTAATGPLHRGRHEFVPQERRAESDRSHRPRSAPAAAIAREDLGGVGRHSGAARARVHRSGGGSWVESAGGGGDEGGGAYGSQGRPRRQNSISFREFLARQAHSQATAKQHLSRLTAQQSPSFAPQLSRGTRRMVARDGGTVASAGGGRFEDRLSVAARRRSRDRKAALVAARNREGSACTFVPQLTPRARTARSRSARELSLGDSVLREAKLRLARAREEIRLLENHDYDNNGAAGHGGRSFEPTFETAGDDGLAPLASSRLRLADELDTYVDRVQEAARQREEHRSRQKRRQQAEEEEACTFQPEMKASRCPDLVKRTAAGMRCIREFRRQQEEQRQQEEAFLLASSSGLGGLVVLPAAAARPRWRYT